MENFQFKFVPIKLIGLAQEINEGSRDRNRYIMNENSNLLNFCRKINELSYEEAMQYQLTFKSSFIKDALRYAYENSRIIHTNNFHSILESRFRKSWRSLYYISLMQFYNQPEYKNIVGKKADENFSSSSLELIDLIYKSNQNADKNIFELFSRSGLNLGDFMDKYEIPINSTLYYNLKLSILSYGNETQLDLVDINETISMIAIENIAKCGAIVNNFIQQKEIKDINPQIIKAILDSYQGPFDRKASDMWQFVSYENKRKINAYINRLRIEQNFGNDERSVFWKSLSHIINEVEFSEINNLIVMHFDHYVIVEFTVKGNAAYIYKKSYFEEHFEKLINKKQKIYASALKNKMYLQEFTRINQFENNYIIHRVGWEKKVIKYLLLMGVQINDIRRK